MFDSPFPFIFSECWLEEGDIFDNDVFSKYKAEATYCAMKHIPNIEINRINIIDHTASIIIYNLHTNELSN